MRRVAEVLVAIWALATPASDARAQVTILSNTPVTQSQVFAQFVTAGPGGLVASTDGNALGIHVNTGVFRGREGTASEGLFLYSFWIEGGDPEFRSLLVPAESHTSVDLDTNGSADSSAYCSNCTLAPVPTPPSLATESADGVEFWFDAGFTNFSTNLYLISELEPRITTGRIRFEAGSDADIQLLPEPETTPVGVAAMVALAATGRLRISRRAGTPGAGRT